MVGALLRMLLLQHVRKGACAPTRILMDAPCLLYTQLDGRLSATNRPRYGLLKRAMLQDAETPIELVHPNLEVWGRPFLDNLTILYADARREAKSLRLPGAGH